MPFAQLQHSKDIVVLDSEYETLFKKIYSILYSNLGGIKSFKTSVNIAHYSLIITQGIESCSFVFLRIFLLKKADRTEEVKEKIGKEILKVLEEFFSEKLKKAENIGPSVEIVDVHSLFKLS